VILAEYYGKIYVSGAGRCKVLQLQGLFRRGKKKKLVGDHAEREEKQEGCV